MAYVDYWAARTAEEKSSALHMEIFNDILVFYTQLHLSLFQKQGHWSIQGCTTIS